MVQPEVIQHRPAPGGVEDAVCGQGAAVLQRGQQGAIRLFVDTRDVGVELQVDALLDHLVLQVIAQRAIEAAHEQLAAIQQLGLGAAAMEDGGELHGDVATADDQHTTW